MSEELRPPEGAEDTRWHWIEDRDGYRRPVTYMAGLWGIGDALVKPSTTGSLGYRYHAPARPDDATERARLEGENARLREALEQCADYFDNRADAEYFPDSAIPVANDEMHMLTVVREALRAAPTIEDNSIVPLCKRCLSRKLPHDCWDENCPGGPAP